MIKATMSYLLDLENRMRELDCNQEYIDECLSYASRLLDNNMPVIFDFKHLSLLLGLEATELTYYLYVDDESFYTQFEIPKKSGKKRIIDVPSERLMEIQRWILDNILAPMDSDLSDACCGFRKDTSIIANASIHCNKPCVLNLDLKDFFPSVTLDRVFYIFFNKGYTKKVSYYLAKLVTKNGVLPQGAPTSPMLSNHISIHLDKRLKGLAYTYCADYTRYADDLTFSGAVNITNMIPIIEKIITEEGFVVNKDKTHYSYNYQRQEVTGLVVNNRVSLKKEYINNVRQELYYCKKYGVNSHLEHIHSKKSFYKDHLLGKIEWIKTVDKKKAEKLIELFNEIEWDY